MRVVEYDGAGGPEVIRVTERDTPSPGPGEVLVEVAAAGVNRPDILQRLGVYPPPPGASDVPGLEISGRVVARGAGVEWPPPGTEVCALVSGGGYASHCLAHAGSCLPIPAGVSVEDAASLPETYFTVWTNLFEDGGLGPGKAALAHGGAGGIGTTAILLAKAFDARIAVTAGGARRVAQCLELGADLAVDHRSEDFAAQVRAWAPDGVDVVLDMIGGDYVPRNLSCLGTGGRHVSIAFLGGLTAEVNLFQLMRKRWVLTGSTLRARPSDEKARLAKALREQVWPRFEDGRLRPVICARLPLEQAARAHALLEQSQQFGKVLLVP